MDPHLPNDAPERYEAYVNWISKSHNLTNLKSFARHQRLPHDFSYLIGRWKTTWHAVLFAHWKSFHVLQKHCAQNAKMLADLLNLMLLYPPSEKCLLVLDIDSLKVKLGQTPRNVLTLNSFIEMKLGFLDKLFIRMDNTATVNVCIRMLIEKLAESLDPELSVLPWDPLEYKAHVLLLNENFQFSGRVKSLIREFNGTPPPEFVSKVMEVVEAIWRLLNMKSCVEKATLMLIIYRLVFDECYVLTKAKYPMKDVLAPLRKLKVKELLLPMQVLRCDDTDLPVIEVFRNDPGYREAIEMLECTQFITNPFDILAQAHRAISKIEETASEIHSDHALVFPFEVTFGLFIGCLVSSDLPDLDRIADFVDKYTPRSGLANNIEYARASLTASVIRCKELNM